VKERGNEVRKKRGKGEKGGDKEEKGVFCIIGNNVGNPA